MKKRYILGALLLCALIVLAASCSADSGKDDSLTSARLESLSSRALTAETDDYDLTDNSKLYWTYSASKDDNLFSTGATDETYLKTDESGAWDVGLPDKIEGFSLGSWTFTFNAYTSSAAATDDGFSSDYLYYKGIATSGVILTSDEDSNVVSVAVTLVEASSGTGSLYVKGLTFLSDNSGTEIDPSTYNSSYGSTEGTISAVVYLYDSDNYTYSNDTLTISDDAEPFAAVTDSDLAMFDTSDTATGLQVYYTDGDSTSYDIPVGYYAVKINLEHSAYGVLASESYYPVYIRSSLDTTVSGSLTENLVSVTIGNVVVNTDGTTYFVIIGSVVYTINVSGEVVTVTYSGSDSSIEGTYSSDDSTITFTVDGTAYTLTLDEDSAITGITSSTES